MSRRVSDEDVVSVSALRGLPPGTTFDPEAVKRANDWCRELGSFAGIVVSGDTLYVGFCSDAKLHLEELRRVLPTTRIRAFVAKHSLVELLSVADRVSSDVPSLRQTGIEISSVGIDPKKNRVVVSLPKDQAGSIAELRARYGKQFVSFDLSGRRYLADHAGLSVGV